MDDYPSNSQRDRPSSKPEREEKKVERVVEGVVVRRKASLFKRFLKLFGFGDIKGVGEFVLYTILIPAAKDTTSEAFGTGLDRIIHGESRPNSHRRSSRYSSRDDNYYNYGNRYNTGSSNGSSRRDRDRDRDRDEPERNVSRRARAAHDFDEIIIPSRHEANEVIEQLCEIISKFDDVSVADLYAMLNIHSDFSDRQWGWTNLRDASVSKVRGGYLLDLPKPEPIND